MEQPLTGWSANEETIARQIARGMSPDEARRVVERETEALLKHSRSAREVKKRLEKAMSVAEKTLNMQFSVSWRPFFLDPNLPGGEGKDKLAHYKLKFGADRVAQMMPRMVQTFAEEGIPGYSIEGNVGNTMDSHRLLEYALRQGGAAKQDKLVEVLFERYFLKGQALSSRQVLLDAAAAADLDGADALLASDQLHDEVWSEVESAYQAGVSGVPHFKIDGGGPGRELSGGQPPEAFLRILRSLP